MDKVAMGQVFSEHFSFPCQSFHRVFYAHHHPSAGAGIIVVDVPLELSHNPPLETKKK
jgi:hypothetical protein